MRFALAAAPIDERVAGPCLEAFGTTSHRAPGAPAGGLQPAWGSGGLAGLAPLFPVAPPPPTFTDKLMRMTPPPPPPIFAASSPLPLPLLRAAPPYDLRLLASPGMLSVPALPLPMFLPWEQLLATPLVAKPPHPGHPATPSLPAPSSPLPGPRESAPRKRPGVVMVLPPRDRRPKSSRYLGVTRVKQPTPKCWRALLSEKSVKVNLGYFSSELEAATAVDNYLVSKGRRRRNLSEAGEDLPQKTENSKFFGVSLIRRTRDGKRWRAQFNVRIDGHKGKKSLGNFATEIEAAIAVDKWLAEQRRPKRNFPDLLPEDEAALVEEGRRQQLERDRLEEEWQEEDEEDAGQRDAEERAAAPVAP